MLSFNKYYFLVAFLVFCVEVFIAMQVHDAFVRPYLGDVLVVILIYCFIKSFYDWPVFPLAMWVLAFAFTIETFQYFNFIEILGLENSKLARTVIGTSFAWMDLLMYVVGIAFVLWVEKMRL